MTNSFEKPYQPSSEEIKKARNMMTKEEKEKSKDREMTYEAGRASEQKENKGKEKIINFFMNYLEENDLLHSVFCPSSDYGMKKQNISKFDSGELIKVLKNFPKAIETVGWNESTPADVLIWISENIKDLSAEFKHRNIRNKDEEDERNKNMAERLVWNESTPPSALENLARKFLKYNNNKERKGDYGDYDDYREILEGLARHKNTPPNILKELLFSKRENVRDAAGKNPNTPPAPLDQRIDYKVLNKGSVLARIMNTGVEFPQKIIQELNKLGIKAEIIKKDEENFLSLNSEKKLFAKQEYQGGAGGMVIRHLNIVDEEGNHIVGIGGFSLEAGVLSLVLKD